MPLDLSGVQTYVEGEILDALLRVYPPSAGHNLQGTPDYETGKIIPAPLPDPLFDGRGAVVNASAASTAVGGAGDIPGLVLPITTTARYRVLLPLAGTEDIPAGAVVHVYGTRLAKPRDPAVIDRWFILGDPVPVSTFGVVRVILADEGQRP